MKLIFLYCHFFIANYLKREQLAKDNQRKEKIRKDTSTGVEFLVFSAFIGVNYQSVTHCLDCNLKSSGN